MEKTGVKIVAKNSKAFHEYFVEERFEAGIELFGTEVKSIRLGTLNLKDAWCSVKDGELWVRQMHISPYEKGNIFNKDPIRPRRLLMHKREIQRLASKVQLDGYAIVPLSVYLKNSRVKVEVALCKGKKLYDKRQDAANKDARRQIDRAPGELEKLVRRFNRQDVFTLTGPDYARSKGEVSDLLRPWYQKKSLSLQHELPLDEKIFSPALADEIVENFHLLLPFYHYFSRLCAAALQRRAETDRAQTPDGAGL